MADPLRFRPARATGGQPPLPRFRPAGAATRPQVTPRLRSFGRFLDRGRTVPRGKGLAALGAITAPLRAITAGRAKHPAARRRPRLRPAPVPDRGRPGGHVRPAARRPRPAPRRDGRGIPANRARSAATGPGRFRERNPPRRPVHAVAGRVHARRTPSSVPRPAPSSRPRAARRPPHSSRDMAPGPHSFPSLPRRPVRASPDRVPRVSSPTGRAPPAAPPPGCVLPAGTRGRGSRPLGRLPSARFRRSEPPPVPEPRAR